MRLVTDPPARNSLGANHVLLSGGQIVPIGENDSFVYGSHPRTLFGWDAHGRVTLMTIGSAVPGRRGGVSLPVAAQMLLKLGVTNAVNLDGGGSSTFVTHGRVVNNPSDGRARSVANAWIVMKLPAGRASRVSQLSRAHVHPSPRARTWPVAPHTHAKPAAVTSTTHVTARPTAPARPAGARASAAGAAGCHAPRRRSAGARRPPRAEPRVDAFLAAALAAMVPVFLVVPEGARPACSPPRLPVGAGLLMRARRRKRRFRR